MAQSTAPALTLPDSQQVLGYLNQTIDWYRHLAIEERIVADPTDLLFVDDDRLMAPQIVRQSFDFARAAAQIVTAQTPAANEQAAANFKYQALAKVAAQSDETVKETQSEVDPLRQKLQNAPQRDRQKLQSTLEETEAEVALAQARSETLHNLLQFMSSGSTGGTSLAAEVQELQRTVPEANPSTSAGNDGAAKPAAPSKANGSTSVHQEEPSGLLAIITDLFSLTRNIHSIDESIRITDSLMQTAQNLRAPLVKDVSSLVQRGNVVAQQADTSAAAALQQQKRELDAMTAQFKEVSSLMLPLSKQAVLLDLYKSNLAHWRSAVKTQYQVELKNLGFRLSILILVVGTFFILGELWKRATFRYVQDFRRRYQFLLLRASSCGSSSAQPLLFRSRLKSDRWLRLPD
jgi:hypothetical protein